MCCRQPAADKAARIMPASTTPVSMDRPAICLLVCPSAELLLDVLVLGPKRAAAVMYCGDTAQTISRGVGFRCAPLLAATPCAHQGLLDKLSSAVQGRHFEYATRVHTRLACNVRRVAARLPV